MPSKTKNRARPSKKANVIEVTASYSRTFSLDGQGSDVKAGVSFTASVDSEQNARVMANALMDDAKEHVLGEIDMDLVRGGGVPAFYKGPLFKVMISDARKAVVLAPESWDAPDDFEINDEFAAAWIEAGEIYLGLEAKKLGYQEVDCRNGEYAYIPELPENYEEAF